MGKEAAPSSIYSFLPKEVLRGPVIMGPVVPDNNQISSTTAPEVERRYQPETDAPMRFLPQPEERKKFTDLSLLPIAEHEGLHSLFILGKGYGNQLHHISLTPNSERTAEVKLKGRIPLKDHQVVAAASSLANLFGPPQGLASDKFQIEIIDLIYDKKPGSSLPSLQAEANSFISSHPKAVREKIYEMMAYFVEIPGSVFPLIVAQAYYEYYMELSGKADQIKGQWVEYKIAEEPKDITMISVISPFHIKVTIKDQGEIVSVNEYKICPICMGINGHAEKCRANPYRVIFKDQSGQKAGIR